MGGCISSNTRCSSRTDVNDSNPNIYHVINIDDTGSDLWRGQIEITRSELVLFRKGRPPTRWPLKCLRRYGFDANLFSFEAGRRCDTGEGIYAFRCERAEDLFLTLQTFIQQSTNEDTVGSLMSSNNATGNPDYINQNSRPPLRLNPSVCSDGTINHIVEVGGGDLNGDETYLEPMPTSTTLRSLSRFHSIGDGTSVPMSPSANGNLNSPGSPNSINNILEVTSLNPLPNYSNIGVSNIYQEFPLRDESTNTKENNLKKLSLDIPPQEQAPPINVNATNVQISPNGNVPSGNGTYGIAIPISPTRSLTNENVDTIPTYMNVTPGEMTPKPISSDLSAFSLRSTTSMSHSTSFGSTNVKTNYVNDPNHCYENLEPNEVRPLIIRTQQQYRRQSKNDAFIKMDSVATSPTADKTSEPSTPTTRKVNYIVLDLDQTHSQNILGGTVTTPASSTSPEVNPNVGTPNSANASPTRIIGNSFSSLGLSQSVSMSSTNATGIASLLPPDSPKKGIFDYATIDFNKTVALSNSTTPSMDCEGSRKTRHSSTAVPNVSTNGMPPSHSNSISD